MKCDANIRGYFAVRRVSSSLKQHHVFSVRLSFEWPSAEFSTDDPPVVLRAQVRAKTTELENASLVQQVGVQQQQMQQLQVKVRPPQGREDLGRGFGLRHGTLDSGAEFMSGRISRL